jgi:hypothetical protein
MDWRSFDYLIKPMAIVLLKSFFAHMGVGGILLGLFVLGVASLRFWAFFTENKALVSIVFFLALLVAVFMGLVGGS